jgi:hypothetical protein
MQHKGQHGDEGMSPIMRQGFTAVESVSSKSFTRFILIAVAD